MTSSLSCYQIRLLRTAIEYFVDAKQDEIEYDWVEGVDDQAIESCNAWIADAWELDELLKIMYRESITELAQ